MEQDKLKELILQSLEHERGGVKIYETALKCVQNEDLKEEWEKYHQETERHVQILHDVCAQMQIDRSEEHTSELQSQSNLVCRLLLEKKIRSEHAVAVEDEEGGRM